MFIFCKGIKSYRIAMSILLLISIFITSACIPESAVKKITAFSTGMENTMTNTEKVFELIEELHLRRKREILANEYSTDPSAMRRFSSAPFFSEEAFDQRMLVINGLKIYAANLKEVVGNEQLEEFDDSTKALGERLKALNTDVVSRNIFRESSLDATKISIFVTAVNTIGRWFIDYKREKVTRQAIREMNTAVNDACVLLAEDIGIKPNNDDGSLKPGVIGLREKVWRNYSDILRERDRYFQANGGSLGFSDKRKETYEIADILQERQDADDTLVAIKDALLAIPVAHRALEKAFDKEDSSLMFRISQVFEEAERIKKFYENLKKED